MIFFDNCIMMFLVIRMNEIEIGIILNKMIYQTKIIDLELRVCSLAIDKNIKK